MKTGDKIIALRDYIEEGQISFLKGQMGTVIQMYPDGMIKVESENKLYFFMLEVQDGLQRCK